MSRYVEGLKIINESCGNGKDNLIALATVTVDPITNSVQPFVREVDAYYEDGTFYVTTWGKSKKIMQIADNKEVGLVVCKEGISGTGLGKNLGWVLDPKNAEIRGKLREAFSVWYDHANNEQDENCVILAIQMTKGYIFRDEGKIQYNLDLINQIEL